MKFLKDYMSIITAIVLVIIAFTAVRESTATNRMLIDNNKNNIRELQSDSKELKNILHKLNLTIERLNTTIKLKLK